jgi:hypothetical protein
MANHFRTFSDSIVFESKRAQMIKSENGLKWSAIKILSEEQFLVLCSALKWRVAIATNRRALKAKTARV